MRTRSRVEKLMVSALAGALVVSIALAVVSISGPPLSENAEVAEFVVSGSGLPTPTTSITISGVQPIISVTETFAAVDAVYDVEVIEQGAARFDTPLGERPPGTQTPGGFPPFVYRPLALRIRQVYKGAPLDGFMTAVRGGTSEGVYDEDPGGEFIDRGDTGVAFVFNIEEWDATERGEIGSFLQEEAYQRTAGVEVWGAGFVVDFYIFEPVDNFGGGIRSFSVYDLDETEPAWAQADLRGVLDALAE